MGALRTPTPDSNSRFRSAKKKVRTPTRDSDPPPKKKSTVSGGLPDSDFRVGLGLLSPTPDSRLPPPTPHSGSPLPFLTPTTDSHSRLEVALRTPTRDSDP